MPRPESGRQGRRVAARQQRPDPNMLRPPVSREGERDNWPTPATLVTALIQFVLPHPASRPVSNA